MSHRFIILLFSLFLLIFSMISCTESHKHDASSKKYSIYVGLKNEKDYLVTTDVIDSGTLDPEKLGVLAEPQHIFHDLIVKDGRYYRLDQRTGMFTESTITEEAFKENKSVKIEGFNDIENYNWISNDTLMLIGYEEKSKKARYAKINVRNMTVVQNELPIPTPFGNYNWMSIGFTKFFGNKLIVGYCYHSTTKLHSYTTSDTLYAEVISYPDMKSIDRLKDTRTTYPGGINSAMQSFFTDEKGDFYFLACPGIATGNVPEKPTGIFRIKAADQQIDPDYFFDISASPIQNHGYGLWYLGKGKAIIRTERKGVFTGVNDHWKVPHIDFYLLDIASQTTKRLKLPLDKGTRKQCVLIENGLAYIAINSDKEGSAVWIYNPANDSLKKGLKLTGEINYFLRLERLN
jgi:hypothetical protein